MRVLCCDFDGVLHPRHARDVPFGTIPTRLFEWVDVLEALLAPHDDVFLVVHSPWRYEWSDAELRAPLGGLAARCLGSVPKGPKRAAIDAWLQRNPSVMSYRILDDEPKGFGDPQPPELIVCHPDTGIYDWRVRQQLRAWLHENDGAGRTDDVHSLWSETHPETPV